MGRSVAAIKADLKREGDLGLVAMVCIFKNSGVLVNLTPPRTRKIVKRPSLNPNP